VRISPRAGYQTLRRMSLDSALDLRQGIEDRAWSVRAGQAKLYFEYVKMILETVEVPAIHHPF